MKKILAALGFWLGIIPAYGEIVFDWSKTNIPHETRTKAEETVTSAALKFMDKQYADLGEYDFVTCKEKYQVVFIHNAQIGYWIPPPFSVIGLDPHLLKNYLILEAIGVHEFSHAYDSIKLQEIHDKTHFYRRIYDTERLANCKERQSLEEGKRNDPVGYGRASTWLRKLEDIETKLTGLETKMSRSEIRAIGDKELQNLFDEMPSQNNLK